MDLPDRPRRFTPEFANELHAARKAGVRAGLLLPDGPQVDVMAAVHPGLYEPGSLLDDAYGWGVLTGIRVRRADGWDPSMPIRWLPDGHGRWNVSLALDFARCLEGSDLWSVERLSGLHLAANFEEARVEANRKPKWRREAALETVLLAAPRGEDEASGLVLLFGHDELELARRSRVRALLVQVIDWTCAQVCWRPA